MTTQHQATHKEIADWLGDLVALESHVEEAMDAQLTIGKDTPLAATMQQLHDTVRDSKRRAVAFQEQYGSEPGNPVVKMGSNLLGKAAGAIDRMRNDSLSKALRDDYTAYNHLAIAYTMLHTTALALGDDAAGTFAEEGLRTYAGLVQQINHLMPEAVVHDLAAGDHAPLATTGVVEKCRATIDQAWKSTSN